MLEIHDCFNAKSVVAEVNNEPSMVMLAGYIPDDLRIKELLLAGERLEAFKYGYTEQVADYDFEGDQPDEISDAQYIDDFMDELEAQDIYNQTMRRIEASMKEREALFSRRLREEQEIKSQTQSETESKEAE